MGEGNLAGPKKPPAITREGAEGRRKGRRGIAPSCCARSRGVVVALRSMSTKSSKALGSKVAVRHPVVVSQVRIASADKRRTLESHGEVAACAGTTILNLHGKVLLAPFCQKSCQLVIESFRLADAGILLGLAIRVEVTRCTILGAEFLRGGGTQANSFPFFRLFSGLHSTLPPAGATLRLHVLYNPVVRHHLDVGTFFVMLDFLSPELLHLHHPAISRDLLDVRRRWLLVRVQALEDIEPPT